MPSIGVTVMLGLLLRGPVAGLIDNPAQVEDRELRSRGNLCEMSVTWCTGGVNSGAILFSLAARRRVTKDNDGRYNEVRNTVPKTWSMVPL